MTGPLTLGIDPGVRAVGWAAAKGGRLVSCGCSRLPRTYTPSASLADVAAAHLLEIDGKLGYPGHIPRVYLETMRAQAGRRTTPQDLIDVQTVGCLLAGSLVSSGSGVTLFAPEEWKGSTPKDIYHARLTAPDGPLRENEIAPVARALAACPKANHKEILDAIGILLYGIGRVDRACRPLGGERA